MRNPALRTGIIVLLALAAIFLYASMFTVHQTQHALVLRFGAVRAVLSQPGLYFKVPLVETVVPLEKRILDLDLPQQTVLSTDRQNLEVDAFARYRIKDPLRFYQAVNNVPNANARLTSLVNSALRNVLANASFPEIIRTNRAALMNRIQDIVNRQADNLGIEIVDLRMTRVDLPAANSQAVYQRMQTERQREAADLRAQGNQQAQTIRARADRDATVIVAEANRRAEELRGEGDAEKNRILAEAYQRDQDFFAFFRSMQAYENGLRAGETRLVLTPNTDFFRYFNDPEGRARNPANAPAVSGTVTPGSNATAAADGRSAAGTAAPGSGAPGSGPGRSGGSGTAPPGAAMNAPAADGATGGVPATGAPAAVPR